jgi:hypothetical protein
MKAWVKFLVDNRYCGENRSVEDFIQWAEQYDTFWQAWNSAHTTVDFLEDMLGTNDESWSADLQTQVEQYSAVCLCLPEGSAPVNKVQIFTAFVQMDTYAAFIKELHGYDLLANPRKSVEDMGYALMAYHAKSQGLNYYPSKEMLELLYQGIEDMLSCGATTKISTALGAMFATAEKA